MFYTTITDAVSLAIKERRVLKFYYEGNLRIVEPFTLGIHKSSGNVSLSAYQIGGYTESQSMPPWRLFNLEKIQDITVTTNKASEWRQGYNRNDTRMVRIICSY